MTTLFVFDLDGTLLRRSSASLELARTVGALDLLIGLESAFAGGRLTTRQFAGEVHELFSTLTSSQVSAAFEQAPWMSHLGEVFADIRGHGDRSLVVTMSPGFFADLLMGFGADKVVGSQFPTPPYSGVLYDPSGILTPDDKPIIVAKELASMGLGPERCVAFGDSLSDAPFFRELSNTVAVNPDPHLAEYAAVQYVGDDLWAAYTTGRGLLA